MYGEIEALVDFYGWTLDYAKKLNFRERKHWYRRAQVRKENKRQD